MSSFWSSLPVLVLLGVQLALPCYLAYDLWRGANASRWAWCLRTAAASAFLAFVFVTGRWDFVGYYWRVVLPVLFGLAIVAGFVRARRVPWLVDGRAGPATPLVSSAATLLLFAGMLLYALDGYSYEGQPVRLSSPLHGGTFYVGQGGDSPLINYHNGHDTQRYALDIVELNPIGTRASSLYPEELDRYAIFGETVRSPCSGRVVAAQDGLPDHVPPETDRTMPMGNHVTIACRGVRLFLAHLQRGSVRLRPDTEVAAGDIVGRVGNSGNTSEPHLHLHAVRDSLADEARPVPILLDGTFAVRNTLLEASE